MREMLRKSPYSDTVGRLYISYLFDMHSLRREASLEEIKPVALSLLDSPLTWWDAVELVFSSPFPKGDKEIESILALGNLTPEEKLEKLLEMVEF